MKKQIYSLEELVANLIANDSVLKKKLNGKIAIAIEKADFETIVVNNIEQAFDAIFESDDIYDLLGEAIKAELKKAISQHFKKVK